MMFLKLADILEEEGFTPYSPIKNDPFPDYLGWRSGRAFITVKQTSAFDQGAKEDSKEYFIHDLGSEKGIRLNEIEIEEREEMTNFSKLNQYKSWALEN